MAQNAVKPTLEEHLDYLEKVVQLKLFFLHYYLETHPEESFRDVLRRRVDIYRKTALNEIHGLCPEPNFEDPRWQKMEDAAEAVYLRTKDDRAAFEREAFEVFRESLRERAPLDYEVCWTPQERPFGTIIPEQALQPDGKTLSIHIANDIAPRSPFEDPDYIPGCLEKVVAHAEKLHAEYISCSSWLNDHPLWCRNFPPSWLENMSEPEPQIEWHFGFWGQFISSRKTFNEKYGARMRATCQFPYRLRNTRCTLAELKSFLADRKKQS